MYVPSVAQEQELLQALEANLRAQAQAQQARKYLEQLTSNREIGQQDALDLLENAFLNRLVSLPFALKDRQMTEQLGAFRDLLETQALLPDKMKDMSLNLGGTLGILRYTDLVSERQQRLTEIGVLAGLIVNANLRIVAIAGDVDELSQQLESVNNTIDLYEGLMATGEEFTKGELTSLYGQRTALVDEIAAKEGALAPLNRQIASQQSILDTASVQLAALDVELTNLQAALDILVFMSYMPYGYQMDSGLRDLAEYSDLLGTDMQNIVSQVSDTRLYGDINNDLMDVNTQTYQVEQALAILTSLQGVTDQAVLDTQLRQLQQYSSILSSQMQNLVGELVLQPPFAGVQAQLNSWSTQLSQTQNALGVVNSLTVETDQTELDAGLRSLMSYQGVLSPSFGCQRIPVRDDDYTHECPAEQSADQADPANGLGERREPDHGHRGCLGGPFPPGAVCAPEGAGSYLCVRHAPRRQCHPLH